MTQQEHRRTFLLRRRNVCVRRGGFAVVEMLITASMMLILAVVLWSSWDSLGKTTVNVMARVQLAQEMDFVAAAFSRDLGGCLADPTPAAQTGSAFPFTNWSVDTSDPTNHVVTISVGDVDDRKIIYRRDTDNVDPWKRNNLIRICKKTKPTESEESRFVVAKNVDSMILDLDANALTIKVNFSCSYKFTNPSDSSARQNPLVKRTCVLVAGKPR